jgi:hypothetical protein
MTATRWGALALAFRSRRWASPPPTIALAIIDTRDAGRYAIILALGVFSLAIGSVMLQQQARRD